MEQQKTTIPKFSVVIPTFNRREQLDNLLQSLIEQDYSKSGYEIIVVNDESADNTLPFLKELSIPNLRYFSIPNSGPSIARNRGAEIATGEYLLFVDDDCTVPIDWISKYEELFKKKNIDAAGGNLIDQIGSPTNKTYHKIIHSLFERHNSSQEIHFLITSNFACKRTVFNELGGFDERFMRGGEDREFVERLYSKGYNLKFIPEIAVKHFHIFSLKSFCFHNYRQGRGGYIFNNIVSPEKKYNTQLMRISDYFFMLLKFGNEEKLLKNLNLKLHFYISQLFFILGFFGAKFEGISNLQEEKAEQMHTAVSGSRGTALGFFSFLSGSLVSNALGFLGMILIGRVLSLSDYGVFVLLQSLHMILTGVGNFGIPSSISRFAADHKKVNDEKGFNELVTSGFIIQLSFSAILLLLIGVFHYINAAELLGIFIPTDLLYLLVFGIITNILLNYMFSTYSARLELIKSSLINIGITLFRFSIILISIFIFEPNISNLYSAFVFSYCLGLVIIFPKFKRYLVFSSRFLFKSIKKIVSFGSWRVVSSFAQLLISNLGPIFLSIYSTKTEAGIFGLGVALSHIYSMLIINIGSYFTPIASHLSSPSEVLPFLKRCGRLSLPIFVASAISLLFSFNLYEFVYGPDKINSAPIFIIYSIPIVLNLIFVSIYALSQYFYNPEYITVATLSSLIVFLLLTYFYVPDSAMTMAVIYMNSQLFGLVVISALVVPKILEKAKT